MKSAQSLSPALREAHLRGEIKEISQRIKRLEEFDEGPFTCFESGFKHENPGTFAVILIPGLMPLVVMRGRTERVLDWIPRPREFAVLGLVEYLETGRFIDI